MDDVTREFFNTFVRVRGYGTTNAADFPPASAGGIAFKVFVDKIPIVEASGALQESNIGKQATASKISAAALLRLYLSKINRTARAASVDHPEIGALFRMPNDNNYQKLIAAAMAFHTNATGNKEVLMEFGMPDDFLTVLQTRINDLQDATDEQGITKGSQVGATANIDAEMEAMHNALRKLRGIVPNTYEDNPAKLAEWATASHIEKPSRNDDQEPGPPTTP